MRRHPLDPFARLESLEKAYGIALARPDDPTALAEREAIADLILSSIDPDWTADHIQACASPTKGPADLIHLHALQAIQAFDVPVSTRTVARKVGYRLRADTQDPGSLRRIERGVARALAAEAGRSVDQVGERPVLWLSRVSVRTASAAEGGADR